MHRIKFRTWLLPAAALAVCLPLSAASVLQMNLEQMVERSDKIFRGTVLGIKEGTVQAGGAVLPTVTYRLRVEEALKGTFQELKGMQVAEVTMVGKLKTSKSGTLKAFSVLPDLPQLKVGQDYLLITTAPSRIGLSTTVGLGQGSFTVAGKPGQELAVNENQNRGLFLGMAGNRAVAGAPQEGPIPYASLANQIRGLVGE